MGNVNGHELESGIWDIETPLIPFSLSRKQRIPSTLSSHGPESTTYSSQCHNLYFSVSPGLSFILELLELNIFSVKFPKHCQVDNDCQPVYVVIKRQPLKYLGSP